MPGYENVRVRNYCYPTALVLTTKLNKPEKKYTEN